ncbi:hypothetical protein K6119_07850 [Paracrocinitomix mangrovi]|uniref:hypothetical protein n=1 Tax=Paracrocinitomix mangrovi TaxID=2862509 RepID=UPI001C8D364F|nr:hypothetical protein [Paracrocinitomix mangrovi]UKN03427.1 hypothetical protein K6119_07850 [Paracrocinitomix mangrovi]
MRKWKRVLTLLLIVCGPGAIIYYLATHLKNKFISLPYVGEWTYVYDADSNIVDSTAYVIPDFNLTRFDGTPLTKDSIEGKFIVLTTLQTQCPDMDSCGINLFLFNNIFFKKLVSNKDNYSNVRVMSILTDVEGNPVEGPSQKIIDEMEQYDKDFWWLTYGDPTPFYSFIYYDSIFKTLPSVTEEGEAGPYAFINSLVLIDDQGHIRGVTGAKRDSDIRNFFDLLKVLKKEEFDAKWEAEHPDS